jgi:predicted PhzF superfamily epimerase YddE/YHI9
MTHPFSLIAVFTASEHKFRGNISAVVFLDKMRDEVSMQRLAADFNQPATTFLAPGPSGDQFSIRWFAPDAEIPLCGHGSMAAIVYLAANFHDNHEFQLNYQGGSILGGDVGNGQCEIALDPIPVMEERSPFTGLETGLGIPVEQYFVTGNKHIVLWKVKHTYAICSPTLPSSASRVCLGMPLLPRGMRWTL